MMALSLTAANRIATTAHGYAEAQGIAPLCIVVLDAGGHVLAVQRDERASIYRSEIATAKAQGCIGMAMGGRELAKRASAMPALYTAFNQVTRGGIIPVPGGVLIRDAGGAIIGAVGVSGDTADKDEAAAVAGIASAGLIADAGAIAEPAL